MSETTITTTTNASKKAATAIVDASPVVADIVDSVLENPTAIAKTVQWTVVGVSVAAGAGLGVAGLWGYNKLRAVRARKALEADVKNLAVTESTPNN